MLPAVPYVGLFFGGFYKLGKKMLQYKIKSTKSIYFMKYFHNTKIKPK